MEFWGTRHRILEEEIRNLSSSSLTKRALFHSTEFDKFRSEKQYIYAIQVVY